MNGTGTTVSGSNQTLTLNLSLSATAIFVGTQQLYMSAADTEGLKSGWQQRGTWTPNADPPPTADSVSPNPASGVNQTFKLKYAAHNGRGYTDLSEVFVRFNGSNANANACEVEYYLPLNTLRLLNDAGTAFQGALIPGTAGTLANSQCTVNGAGTSVAGLDQTLTLSLSVTAKAGFVGAKSIYRAVVDSEGSNSGWQTKGMWTPSP